MTMVTVPPVDRRALESAARPIYNRADEHEPSRDRRVRRVRRVLPSDRRGSLVAFELIRAVLIWGHAELGRLGGGHGGRFRDEHDDGRLGVEHRGGRILDILQHSK